MAISPFIAVGSRMSSTSSAPRPLRAGGRGPSTGWRPWAAASSPGTPTIWKRASGPRAEVDGLMALLGSFLRHEAATLATHDVRLSLIGRRDRLPLPLGAAVTRAETETAGARGLHLRLAVDYSARDMILRAARRRLSGPQPREAFAARLGQAYGGAGAPDVDLLIRAGGEQRLSDFLLWESADAELRFVSRMWPDFTPADLAVALDDFHARDRRFGALALAGSTPSAK